MVEIFNRSLEVSKDKQRSDEGANNFYPIKISLTIETDELDALSAELDELDHSSLAHHFRDDLPSIYDLESSSKTSSSRSPDHTRPPSPVGTAPLRRSARNKLTETSISEHKKVTVMPRHPSL